MKYATNMCSWSETKPTVITKVKMWKLSRLKWDELCYENECVTKLSWPQYRGLWRENWVNHKDGGYDKKLSCLWQGLCCKFESTIMMDSKKYLKTWVMIIEMDKWVYSWWNINLHMKMIVYKKGVIIWWRKQNKLKIWCRLNMLEKGPLMLCYS